MTDQPTIPAQPVDEIATYTAAQGFLRIFAVLGTQCVAQARAVHGLSLVATAALGRVVCATAMLAGELKSPHASITATISGDGPLGRICAVARPGVMLKAFVDQPTVELPPRADGKLDVAGAVGRRGRLSVVRDLGMREPYTGQVNLVSGEIAQDFAMYLAASEQQPALVALGVRFGAGAVLRSAGGIIVQPLPQCPESVIADVEARADKLIDISLQLDTLGGARAVVEHLLADLQPVFLGAQPLSWQCDCSRDRLERILGSLGADELEDMIREQGGAQAHCHFCNRTYTFDAARLRELAARIAEEQ